MTRKNRTTTLILIAAATLTLSACSDKGAEEKMQESAEQMMNQTQELASEIKEAASESAEQAKESVEEGSAALQESLESARETAEKTATAAVEKGSAMTSAAVSTVTEKAAEAKTEIKAKIAAVAPAASSGNDREAMLDLAKQSGCLACHAVDKKVMGPAWKDVAAKYRGQSGAKEGLIASISQGSSGKWGAMAMPANSPRVSDDNIAKLTGFILSLE